MFMSLTASEMSAADIAAVTGNCNNNSGWGNGNFGDWIILFLIFGMFGWNNGGGFFGGGGNNAGAAENYVLASDFATIQRQLSDGFNAQERRTDAVINGICDLGYTQQSLANTTNMNVMQGNYNTLNAIQQNGYESRLATQTLGSQLSNCCCDIREGISNVNYNMAMNSNALQRQISDCCCDTSRQIERGFCDTNYNLATQNNATLIAIDKVGDRIIDYMAQQNAQALRDENQALRLAASQARQNELLIDRLGPKCPTAAYVVQPPQQVTFPTNCCGGVNYASNSGCGCGL
jgi:hypothetical protein